MRFLSAQTHPYTFWILFAVTSLSLRAADKEYFRPDAPGMPDFTLPDLLKSAAGQKITTAEEWKNIRRPEILELFRTHEYGRVPATPFQTTSTVANVDANAMSGAATLKQVNVIVSSEAKSLTIHVVLFIPNKVPKPVPTFLLICNREPENFDPTRKSQSGFWPAEEIVARGYGIAAFYNADVAPDVNDGFKHGAFDLLGGSPRAADSWGALAAWSWGASRVMDYFETDNDIAHDKVAIVGHSRGGKSALWAGAQDERFALTISNDSGCGGASLSKRRNTEKESIAKINKTFPHWFCQNFKSYSGNEDKLPLDQHMLLALIAPRALYVASARQDLWADPRGEFLSSISAGPAFQLFGKQGLAAAEMPAIGEPILGDGVAYHIREGKHDLTSGDWMRFLDFADKIWSRH